jgi:hypothetical protein
MGRFAMATESGRSNSLRGLFRVTLLCAAAAILCRPAVEAPNASPVNVAPSVHFVTSPLDGAIVSARITIEWRGADPDGFIDGFEYSVDAQEWVTTPDTIGSFVFSTPDAESTMVGSQKLPIAYFRGTHTLRVRAVDNEGATSDPVSATFTARTQTPEALITKPIIGTGILNVGSTIRAAWGGADPDGPSPEARPVAFLYKLLQTNTIPPGIPLQYISDPTILYSHGGAWTYQSADTVDRIFSLAVPAQYVLGIRAVDESGAIEPFLEFGRNAFKFQAGVNWGVPKLTLEEPVLGKWSCSIPDTFDAKAPMFRALHFTVSCSAEAQGETCPDMRWGLDLADPAQPAGWSEWLPVGDLPSLTFFDPAVHRLFVQVRDSYDTVTTALLRIEVIEFPFDRGVLWVDDRRDQTYPNDTQHDAFWASLFRDSARFGGDWTTSTQVFRHEVFGPNDTGTTIPNPPSLTELARYRLVIWETFGDGYNGYSGLLASASAGRDLATYLAAGGNLWVGGPLTVPPLLPPPTPTGPADFVYPKDVTTQPNSFAFRFMKLASSRIMNAKGVPTNDNLVGALVFPGKPATYPAMQQDVAKVSPYKLSVSHCDAIFGPILAQNAGIVGVIDSLYVYQAKVTTSTFHNRLVALRWHDPSPAPLHGRVQWFGFPLYYMKQAQAQDTFNRSIDWFRSAPEPVPVILAYFTADRQDDGVVLAWTVADASDHAGFHVYREVPGGERERLTESLLTGRDSYTFTDPNPPLQAADYWLAERSRTGAVTWFGPVRVEEAMPIHALVLGAPLPNPFADGTRISYSLPAASRVRLSVFDILGRRVIDLVDELRPSGINKAVWNGSGEDGRKVAAGFYLVRLQAGDEIRVRKVVLIR